MTKREVNLMLKITLLMSGMMTMLANAVVSPALPLINQVFAQTPNAELLTKMMMTLPSLTIAIVAPFAGRLVDAIGRLRVLLAALVIYALAGTSGLWLQSLQGILIGRVLLGFGVAGIMTASTTLVGDYFVGEKRQSFMGLQGSFTAVGGLLFISLSGVLADINWRLPFAIYFYSVLVLMLAPFFLWEPERHAHHAQTSNQKPFRASSVIVVFVSGFVSMVFFYIVPVQVPFFVKSMEGVTNAMAGMAVGAMTLNQAIVSLFYRRVKRSFSHSQIYAISFSLMALGLWVISLSQNYWSVIAGILIRGVGTGWLFPNANLWLIGLVPERVRGRYVGGLSAAMFFGMFASPLAIQPVQHWVGIRNAFVVMALALVFFALLHLLYHKLTHPKPQTNA